jgi:SAM-dependent methyltransferase
MGRPVEGAPRATLDQGLRYDGVVRFLQRLSPSEVLEIGSGSSGLAAWWPGPVTGVDLRFDGDPLPNLSTIAASAADLPFADRQFDAVVCVDVFEHLPPPVRRAAWSEMLRVARRAVWLAYPCGRAATRADRMLAATARALRRSAPGWLAEHLEDGGLPAAESLSWPAEGFRSGTRRSLSCVAHVATVLIEHAPGGTVLDRLAAVGACRRALLTVPGPRYRLEHWLIREESRPAP